MTSLKQFILFDKVQFLEANEHIEYLEDGNVKYPPEAAYHLYYRIISLVQDSNITKVVEKKDSTDIDDELDSEQNSKKDGISFCKTHNDAVFKVILDEYKSLLKEDASYKNESPVTAPQVKNYEFIVAKFRDWYRRNGITLPVYENSEEFPQTQDSDKKMASQNTTNLLEKISWIDEKKEVFDNAVSFINNEILKLKPGYKRKDIINICANAFEEFVPLNTAKKEKNINVTEYAEEIFPRINHKISGWTIKQFQKFLRPLISPKQSK